jgi:hypothetical protein
LQREVLSTDFTNFPFLFQKMSAWFFPPENLAKKGWWRVWKGENAATFHRVLQDKNQHQIPCFTNSNKTEKPMLLTSPLMPPTSQDALGSLTINQTGMDQPPSNLFSENRSSFDTHLASDSLN